MASQTRNVFGTFEKRAPGPEHLVQCQCCFSTGVSKPRYLFLGLSEIRGNGTPLWVMATSNSLLQKLCEDRALVFDVRIAGIVVFEL